MKVESNRKVGLFDKKVDLVFFIKSHFGITDDNMLAAATHLSVFSYFYFYFDKCGSRALMELLFNSSDYT